MGAVGGFGEGQLPATGVGGHELVAPAVGLFQGAQLRAGRGAFTAAQDPHVGRPVLQVVPAGADAQQPSQLDHSGAVFAVEITGRAVAVPHVLPVILADVANGGAGAVV